MSVYSYSKYIKSPTQGFVYQAKRPDFSPQESTSKPEKRSPKHSISKSYKKVSSPYSGRPDRFAKVFKKAQEHDAPRAPRWETALYSPSGGFDNKLMQGYLWSAKLYARDNQSSWEFLCNTYVVDFDEENLCQAVDTLFHHWMNQRPKQRKKLLEEHQGTLNKLIQCCIKRAETLDPKQLMQLVRVFARLGIDNPLLFRTLSKEIQKNINSFDSVQLSTIAWSYAKVGHDDKELFSAIAAQVVDDVANLSPKQIANIAWSYATLGFFDSDLFESLAYQVEKKGDQFNEQDMANTLWAFAIVNPDYLDGNNLFKKAEKQASHFERRHLLQIFHASLRLEQVDLGSYPTLRERIVTHLQATSKETRKSSLFHQGVMKTLDEMRIEYNSEVFETGYFLDTVLKDKDSTIVEVDGRTHFLLSGACNGAGILRDKILAFSGRIVVHISYKEWDRLSSPKDKQDFLREKIKAAKAKKQELAEVRTLPQRKVSVYMSKETQSMVESSFA